MAGPFYFAWVGGPGAAAFALRTQADLWGGSLATQGTTWGGEFETTGDLVVGSNVVANVADVLPLAVGTTYFIQGPGIPQNSDGTAKTTFTHDGSASLKLSATVLGVIGAGMAGANLKITGEAARLFVTDLVRTDGLVIGEVYAASGSGIQPGATATWDGLRLLLSAPATATAWHGGITLSNAGGRNQARLYDTSGLVLGLTYQFLAPGLPAATFFTWDGSAVATLTADAGETHAGAFVMLLKGRSEDDGGPFDPVAHRRNDEEFFSFEILHREGECATLKLRLKNPKIGLLAPGRKQWCWFSYDTGSELVPLLHGRLVAVPAGTRGEVAELEFTAKPVDFDSQKAALAATKRSLPNFDPVFLQQELDNPDTALETTGERWHIDRVSLAVTASNLLDGEDGTLEFGERGYLYDSLDLSFGQAPLAAIAVDASVTWTQAGSGQLDMTAPLVAAFQDVGSPFAAPLFGSFTSDGLLQDWPKPGQAIGAGWSVALEAFAVPATWSAAGTYNFSYIDQEDQAATLSPYLAAQIPQLSFATRAAVPFTQWFASFPLNPIMASLLLNWEAARERSERVQFLLTADMQDLLADPGGALGESLTLSSAAVALPVDDGGALPIGDTRRSSYFLTQRGDQSIQFLLLLAAAKLQARARAVTVKFAAPFAMGLGLSCRQNASLVAARLPGGEAIGKIVQYRLSGEFDSGAAFAEISIGCAIGHGDSLAPPGPPIELYAEDYAEDWTSIPALAEPVPGILQYVPLDGSGVDDDGVDLFNLTADSALLAPIAVLNGPTAQKLAIDTQILGPTGIVMPDPIGTLKRLPTRPVIDLVPVTGGAFRSAFLVETMPLQIPKGIDLEAAAM